MTPDALVAAITAALAEVPETRDLDVDVRVERPKNRDHGDWATNVALVSAKRAGLAPPDLAAKLVAALQTNEGIARLDIAGPGFINITLAADAQGRIAADIVAAGSAYGRIDALSGTAVNLEFISANPTGPLHLGHTRWAAVGDAMARVLHDEKILCEPDSREPWFICEAHDESCMKDTLAAFEKAVDATLQAGGVVDKASA